MNDKKAISTDELGPCPWCGGREIKTFIGGEVEYAQCMQCTACGPDHKNGRHWNRGPGIVRHSEVERLMRFYSVETLEELIAMQAHHVERLQARLPPTPDTQPRKSRFA